MKDELARNVKMWTEQIGRGPLPGLQPDVYWSVDEHDDGEGQQVVQRARRGRVQPPRVRRQVDLAVKLLLDHERKVPEIGVNEHGRDDQTTEENQEESNDQALKATIRLLNRVLTYFALLVP